MPPRKPTAKPTAKPLATVTTLFGSNFRDIPTTLRIIAEQIEAGEFGEVKEGALVISGVSLEVFGLGETNHDGGSTHLILGCAMAKLQNAVLRYMGEIE